MAENSQLKNALSELRSAHFIVLALFVVMLLGAYYLKTHSFSGIDRSDYLLVAEHFIYNNPTIAQKIGKVRTVKLLGAGGSAGKLSYNSFSVRGDKSGLCQVTLEKDAEALWDVKSATLMVSGAEYDIPVSRKEEKRAFKIFGN